MSLSEDQLHTLNLMVNQVNNIQETLPGQLETINKSINELQGRMGHFEVQLREVYNQVQTQQNSNLVKPNAIKIKLPTSFSGQSSLCSTFFSQLSLYFAGNLNYDTGDKKILLATSCLSGPAYAYMEPFLGKLNAPTNEKPEVLTNYQVFVDTITAAFGDSDPTMSAEVALRRLRQNGSATAYATEFRRLSSVVFWNNAALVSQYKVNLRDPIQDELARRPVIQDLEELILESIDIDNRLFQRQRTKRYDRTPAMASDSRTPPTSSTSMDIDKPSIINQAPRHVPQDERLRRNQEKACYYCGVNGHFSNQCPAKKTGHQRQAISTVLLGEYQPTYPSINMVSPRPSINMARSDITQDLSQYKPVIAQDEYRCVQVRYNHQEAGMVYIPVRIGPNLATGHCQALALLDTGAAISVISKSLVDHLKLPIVPHELGTGRLEVADGNTPESSGTCTTMMRLGHTIFHSEQITFYVMDGMPATILLGLDWFQKHGVNIDFQAHTTLLHCDTKYCCDNGVMPPIVDHVLEYKPNRNFAKPAPKEIIVPFVTPEVTPEQEQTPFTEVTTIVPYLDPPSPSGSEDTIVLSYPENPLLPSCDYETDCSRNTSPFINKDTVYFYSS